jgi:hypothetical protein
MMTKLYVNDEITLFDGSFYLLIFALTTNKCELKIVWDSVPDL